MPQKCQGVRKYGHDLATEDSHFLGGFAEYCYILPGTWILKLPPDLSDEEATPLNCGVATMTSVTEAAETALGDAAVIQGLGLLGLYGAAMAKARGARCVMSRCRSKPARHRQKIRRRSRHRRFARLGKINRRSSQDAVPARRRRCRDRGLRHPGRHTAGPADAEGRRPLCARRLGKPRRQCDHRRQYAGQALDHKRAAFTIIIRAT